MSEVSQEIFDSIVQAGQDCFWNTAAALIPEAKTGDLSPDMVFQLERVMREALAEWIENNVPSLENKTVEVLLHNVEYWYSEADETVEIDEFGIEHIAYSISQGMREGELFTAVPDDEYDNTYAGWWAIKFK